MEETVDNDFCYFSRQQILQSTQSPGGGKEKFEEPVKSEPRKKTSVRRESKPPQVIDLVDWSKKSFVVEELARMFTDRFPIILRVTKGYMSESGAEYSIDQVLQIHGSAIQKRVLATDDLNRVISIPVDYPVNIDVQEIRANIEDLPCILQDVLKATPLPIISRVTGWTEETKSRPGLNLVNLKLKFLKVVESPFLYGNAIIDGWIDQTEIVILPCVLGLQFSVGLGLHGAGDAEWKEYKNMFERTIRHLKFENSRGFKEAVFVSEPHDINMADLNSSPDKLHQRVQKLPANEKVYIDENVKFRELNKRTVGANAWHEDGKLSQAYENGLEKAESEEKVLVQRRKSSEDNNSEKRVERSSQTPKAVVSPIMQGRKRSGRFVTSIRVGGDETVIHRPSLHKIKDQVSLNPDIRASNECEKSKHKAAARLRRSVKAENGERINYKYPQRMKNDGARKACDVTVLDEAKKYNAASKSRPKSKEFSLPMGTGIQDIEDIPEELNDMTVEDVCACLELLSMPEYSTGFRRKQVDGGLLIELDKDILLKEFNFSPFNASKLIRFTRGWRPKLI